MPTIVHFEILTDNVEKSKKFYSELFGWSIKKVLSEELPEGVKSWKITTKAHECNTGVNGGMSKRMAPRHWVSCCMLRHRK